MLASLCGTPEAQCLPTAGLDSLLLTPDSAEEGGGSGAAACLSGAERGLEEGIPASVPSSGLGLPAFVLTAQLSGWRLDRKDQGTCRMPCSPRLLCVFPRLSRKIYGKIKGPFFQYLLIFMAVFTAICF